MIRARFWIVLITIFLWVSINLFGEYIQFLGVADASAAELETQLIIAKELYPNVDYVEAEVLLAEIQKMLFSLITKLKTNRQTKP